MISQSEDARSFELGAQRSSLAVVDLLMRGAEPRGIVALRFPDFYAVPEVEAPFVAMAEEEVGPDLESELQSRIAAAREEGSSQAEGEYGVELMTKLAEERRRVDRLKVEFARDRQRFFAAAESQVVRLALAVAGRILSREVASDGLHLRATVKAALARVQDSSVTTLRVAPEEVEAWATLFQRSSAGKVKVVGDERMSKGECVLETTVGRVELGVEVQLAEIERGFRELVQGDGWETETASMSGVGGEQDRAGAQ